jgi:hypothetical protein
VEGDRWPFAFPVTPLAAAIPTDIPATLTAGDTWQWTKYVNDYSAADGWVLKYYLRGASTVDITATTDTDGIGFAITKAATDTAALGSGTYQYLAEVALAGVVHTVGSGSVVILPNLRTADAGDMQSFAEQMVTALEAALLADAAAASSGGTGGLVLSYTIAGRSVTFRDEDAVRKALNHYKWQVWQEQHKGQLPRRQVRFVG